MKKYDLYHDDLLQIVRESNLKELPQLAKEIRSFLIEKVSHTGGHLASNLGVVELTMAIHRIYHSPEDKIIFDVGHQSYVHKILTGRAGDFDTLRQFKGLSGFPKSRESEHDAFDTGHSSTSLGAAQGYAIARDLRKENHEVVALIGDGAMTGGLAYEALNNIGSQHTKVRIILNDNQMSIARNVGALSKHLNELRRSENYSNAKKQVKRSLDQLPVVGDAIANSMMRTKDKIKYSVLSEEAVFFESLGVKYIGPVDGYNFEEMCRAFRFANTINGPTLVHVITKKGKGYYYSEKYPRAFHGVNPFIVQNGNILSSNQKTYSKVFGDALVEQAKKDSSIVAITAAMGTATGLGPFCNEFPERYFDVGIAEQDAVLFAAGLAKGGMTPVCVIYSSFLQRAYDQIIEDVAIQNLHVVLCIDRAGLVGADGETHHGMFDLSYLRSVPNLTVLSPADEKQLTEMLDYAIHDCEGPVAIRYPRGAAASAHENLPDFCGQNSLLTAEGEDASSDAEVAILAVGAMLDLAQETAELLKQDGYRTAVYNVACVKPFDASLTELSCRLAVTLEDNTIAGGFGECFKAAAYGRDYDVLSVALPDAFVEQGSVAELREELGITPSSIAKGVKDQLERKA